MCANLMIFSPVGCERRNVDEFAIVVIPMHKFRAQSSIHLIMWSSLVFGNRQFQYQMLLAVRHLPNGAQFVIWPLEMYQYSILYHRLNWKILSASYVSETCNRWLIPKIWRRGVRKACILNTLRNCVYPSNAKRSLPKWQYIHACKSIEPHTLHHSIYLLECSWNIGMLHRPMPLRAQYAPARSMHFRERCKTHALAIRADYQWPWLSIEWHHDWIPNDYSGINYYSFGSMVWQYWHWRAS